ncbi:MAG: sugar phosphate nucleotidyltransferase [Candidatus Zixiibacteriota bacterium]
MKGVILAGGLGTRLYPLTKITNKHLLPVYDQPMIYYPIQTLVKAGITDIMIVAGGNHAGDFLQLLGNGKDFGLNGIRFAYQEGEDGIASALALAKHFVGSDRFCTILGDNIIQDDIKTQVRDFAASDLGAYLFLKEVDDARRFGVAEIGPAKQIVAIEEKPKNPKSNLAVIGVYLYDDTVFDVIAKLKPSARGEYEITDVSNHYVSRNSCGYHILKGWWSDAGTFESLLRAHGLVRDLRLKSTGKGELND